MSSAIVSVLTASSNSGKACVKHLLHLLQENNKSGLIIRAAFRSQEKADAVMGELKESFDSDFVDANVVVVVGVDANSPSTLVPAFEGAKVAVIVTPIGSDGFEKDAELCVNMVNTAVKQCHVPFVVNIGSWTVHNPDQVPGIAQRFTPVEKLLEELGADEESSLQGWTHLRGGYFTNNFAHIFPNQLKGGNTTIRFPFVHLPPCDPRDIGKVAAVVSKDFVQGGEAALKHTNKPYEISGPEMLSTKDIVAKIATATSQPLSYEAIPASSLEHVLPPALFELLVFLEEMGEKAVPISTDVEDVVGHVVSLDEWLQEFGDQFKISS